MAGTLGAFGFTAQQDPDGGALHTRHPEELQIFMGHVVAEVQRHKEKELREKIVQMEEKLKTVREGKRLQISDPLPSLEHLAMRRLEATTNNLIARKNELFDKDPSRNKRATKSLYEARCEFFDLVIIL